MRPSRVSWKRVVRLGMVTLVGLALFVFSLAVVPDSAPVAAQPRPTLTSPGGPPQPTQAPGFAPPASPCDSICGRTINLETGAGEPEQAIHFAGLGDAWLVGEVTDAGGQYFFGRLGTDVGLLNLHVPEGSGLHPVTTDIAVAPRPGLGVVVNLGFYRNAWTAPPLAPTVWAEPSSVLPGGEVTFVVRVDNRLSDRITGVAVTDYLPEGLLLTKVTADRGGVHRAGNYGAAFIGEMAPGETATVRLVADVALDAPSTVRNRVSLVYREHAASQAVAALAVGRTPTASAAPARQTISAATASPEMVAATEPAFLPVTGYGLTALGVGLGLAITALSARLARQRRQRKRSREEESS